MLARPVRDVDGAARVAPRRPASRRPAEPTGAAADAVVPIPGAAILPEGRASAPDRPEAPDLLDAADAARPPTAGDTRPPVRSEAMAVRAGTDAAGAAEAPRLRAVRAAFPVGLSL